MAQVASMRTESRKVHTVTIDITEAIEAVNADFRDDFEIQLTSSKGRGKMPRPIKLNYGHLRDLGIVD